MELNHYSRESITPIELVANRVTELKREVAMLEIKVRRGYCEKHLRFTKETLVFNERLLSYLLGPQTRQRWIQ